MTWKIYGREYKSLDEIRDRVRALNDEHPGQRFPDAIRDEWNALNAVLEEQELEVRRERLRELAAAGHTEAGTDLSHRGAPAAPDRPGSVRDAALQANERAEFLPDQARAHMERMLRSEDEDDPDSRLARFVVETSDRDYFRAFAKWMRDPVSGGHEWSPQEREAVQRVRRLERSLTLGTTGTAGGFLVPYELDPNIIIAGTGAVDPMRQVARVVTTAQNEKRFVTSTGVTTAWYAEEAEVADHSPTLLQPTITCRKAMSFVPVSFELYEDSSIAQQIGALFTDAKATEEARVFTTGNGTTEPKGIITALAAVGGSVLATGTNSILLGDVYANQAALPPRWRPRGRFMANLNIINVLRQLQKSGSIQESLVEDSSSPPRMLGWQLLENSNMDGTLTASANDYALLSGDFQQFAIVDRIGTTIEVVPQLFGANRRPTGQRGFLMHWRVGSDVLVPDAFRLTNYSG